MTDHRSVALRGVVMRGAAWRVFGAALLATTVYSALSTARSPVPALTSGGKFAARVISPEAARP